MSRRRRSRRKRRLGVAVPLASMGDIAFLLIIFFIIASNFTKDPPAEVQMARSMQVDPLAQARVLVVIDQEHGLWVNGEPRDSAEQIEWEVLALLEGRDEPEQRVVHLKVDRRAPKRVYEPVINAIAQAGGVLAAVGEEGEARDE